MLPNIDYTLLKLAQSQPLEHGNNACRSPDTGTGSTPSSKKPNREVMQK